MHDNARHHQWRIVKAYFEKDSVNTVPRLARSPDLKLIEHMFGVPIGQANTDFGDSSTDSATVRSSLTARMATYNASTNQTSN